jgi:hypothetical protein
MDQLQLTQRELQGFFDAFIDQHIIPLNEAMRKNQPIIDGMVSNDGRRPVAIKQKNLGTEIFEQLAQRKDEVIEFQKSRHNKLTLELKTSGVLLTSDHVTGDTVATYNTIQALEPNHLVNFRDLIRTTPSPTGTMVTYEEGTVSNNFANQVEGNQKNAQDYTWIERKVTSSYLSARTKFSKQLMYSLPFLQNTLTVELLRDFYKKENELFYDAAVLAANGDNTTTGANTAEQILDLIANQLDASFVPSFVIVKPRLWKQLLATKGTAEYGFPGGISVDGNGTARIAGSPLIPAAWADADTILVIDANRIERLETETVRVEFAFTNEDDWIRNLVCARIECFENINFIRPDSIISTTTS